MRDNRPKDVDTKREDFPLPCELIAKILLRLPVKSLVRFRLVSNSWSSLILSTQFAKSHFDLVVAPQKLLSLAQFGHEARLIDVNTSNGCNSTMIRPPILRNSCISIAESCRGFILLASYQHIILWNPSIGVHKPLSYSSVASNALRTYKPLNFWGGLGYDAPNDDYLVVLGWQEADETLEFKPHSEVFSVRTNAWKEIRGICFPSPIVGFQSAMFFNGVIHWLPIDDGHAEAYDFPAQGIITFDLVGKNFSKISLPDIIGGFFRDLQLLGGCLSVSHYCMQEDKVEIWVMKEYNVRSSWTKVNVVLPYKENRINPVCFTKSGELVATNDCGHLVKFNDEAKYVEFQPECYSMHKLVVFTETLLSLPPEFGKAKEEDH